MLLHLRNDRKNNFQFTNSHWKFKLTKLNEIIINLCIKNLPLELRLKSTNCRVSEPKKKNLQYKLTNSKQKKKIISSKL